jgi:hypothetical protein
MTALTHFGLGWTEHVVLPSVRRRIPMAEPIPFSQTQDKLRSAHYQRFVEYMRLTISLSFGGLMFLLAFEKDYSGPTSRGRWMVFASWLLMWLSSMTGLGLMFIWVRRPLQRLDDTWALAAQQRSSGTPSGPIPVPKASPWFYNALYRIHLLCLIAAMTMLAVFKAINWCAPGFGNCP